VNIIEKKRIEHAALIREIGSIIRIEGLDKDIENDSEIEAFEAKANSFLEKYAEADVKEGLEFAAYLAYMTDPDCKVCLGRGALKDKQVSPSFVEPYGPCFCAEKNEKKRKEALPAVKVKSTRESDLDHRIVEFEKRLDYAKKNKEDATELITLEIKKVEDGLVDYVEKRKEINSEIEECSAEVSSVLDGISALYAKIREAEAHLRWVKAEETHLRSALIKHDVESEEPVVELAALKDKMARVLRHHDPKIEKIAAKITRLKYLRGETPKVSAEEVKVSFGPL
jgi:hypothetical protein